MPHAQCLISYEYDFKLNTWVGKLISGMQRPTAAATARKLATKSTISGKERACRASETDFSGCG